MFKPVFLWTDILLYLLTAGIGLLIFWMNRHAHWRQPWRMVFRQRLGMVALVLLAAYFFIALLDSVHFRVWGTSANTVQSQNVQSLLDKLLWPIGAEDEKTYSAPFALHSYSKMVVRVNGKDQSIYPRLLYAGKGIINAQGRKDNLIKKALLTIFEGASSVLLVAGIVCILVARKKQMPVGSLAKQILKGQTDIAIREILLTLAVIIFAVWIVANFAYSYHFFGTDKIGKDVLYETLKSIRTGLVIGTLTTLVMLPFAVLLGMLAGYLGGLIDDIIQYVYTTLSSIPGVLLITATVLSLEIFISNHTAYFPTLESRADARLLALCIILGITSWTSLCRLIRAETLKLREMDFVRAAIVMGVSRFNILLAHILPNVLHIIIITIVIDFSGLVLAEAVLSYVGVGVDPTTYSWGNMINTARLDLAREPIVWWPLLAAFILMFALVFAANLFADAIRDAFDPRVRRIK